MYLLVVVVGKRRGAPIGAAFFALLCVLGVCAGGEHFTANERLFLPHCPIGFHCTDCFCVCTGTWVRRGSGELGGAEGGGGKDEALAD